jgi:hypothetical protein
MGWRARWSRLRGARGGVGGDGDGKRGWRLEGLERLCLYERVVYFVLFYLLDGPNTLSFRLDQRT